MRPRSIRVQGRATLLDLPPTRVLGRATLPGLFLLNRKGRLVSPPHRALGRATLLDPLAVNSAAGPRSLVLLPEQREPLHAGNGMNSARGIISSGRSSAW